ncbi:TPA: transcription factor [Trebouxia sp. C0006]
MVREIKLQHRGWFNLCSRTLQIGFLAFLSATLFFKPGHDTIAEGQRFLLDIFFAALVSIFAGFGKIPETVLALPVFYKQRENKFFPAWCYALPMTLLDIPLALWEAVLWTAIPYFTVGYYKDAGRFFIFFLVLFLTNTASNALFRGCAAVGRDPIVSSTVGVLAMYSVVFSGGIMLARIQIRGWWIWAYWISPVSFAVRSLALNEFTTEQWSAPYEYDPTISIGDATLATYGVQTGYWWVWLGIGVLAGYAILFNVITTLALTFLSYPQHRPAMSEEAAAAIDADAARDNASQSKAHKPFSDSAHGFDNPDGVTDGVTNGYTKPQKTVDASQVAEKGVEGGEGNGAVANPGLAYGGAYQAADGGALGAAALSPSAGSYAAAAGTTQPETGLQPVLSHPGKDANTIQDGDSDGIQDGLALPFVPVALVFKDVHYYVKHRGGSGELQLLKGITGAFRPGVLTALMGASGAGKTTLMDVLADRKTGGRTTGEQKLNGIKKAKATLARVMGYVEQSDIHTPALTVIESLTFSARLRLPRNVNKRSEAKFVDNVLDLVDMQGLRNALVGLPGYSGLSVEQRKRLTVAVELVANPSIVFMDEPTSGLDARAAAIVMKSVKNTVRTGRTVVCTIHQPSMDIFRAFDALLLLQRGGSTLYCGPLGQNAQDLISYFENLGVDKISPNYNAATWMLENTTVLVEEKKNISFSEVFQESDLRRITEETVDELSQENGPYKPIHFKEKYAKRVVMQYTTCLRKFSIAYWRTPEYNCIRALVTVSMGFVLGTLYWKVGHHRSTEQDVITVVAAADATTLFLGALYSLDVLPIISVERAIFYRERSAFFYHSLPFSLAQCTVELPYIFVQAYVYTCIIYWCCGFEADAGKFFWFLLFQFLTLDYFTHVGIMSANLSPSLQIATTVVLTLVPTWNVLSGFYVPKPVIRGWWLWAYYLNPLAWTTYGLVASQLGDVQSLVSQSNGSQISIADYVSTTWDFQHSHIGWCLLILLGFCTFFRVLSAIALQQLHFQSR